MHSIDGLKRGIEHAKKNIKTFEDAIEKERETISKFYEMIDVLKQKERNEADAKRLEELINADISRLLQ